VQQHQDRLAGIAGTQVSGPDSSNHEIALLKRDTLEVTPDALELHH
jgi:hypothetical protein